MSIPVIDVTNNIKRIPVLTRGSHWAESDADAVAFFSKFDPAPIALYKIRKDYFAEFETNPTNQIESEA